MKPAKAKATKERKAKAEFYRIARRIPDNAALMNILFAIPDRPIKEGFYRNVKDHLRFKPVPLEEIL